MNSTMSSEPSPSLSNSEKTVSTSFARMLRRRSSSCILSTTLIASFSSHTRANELPTMVMGIAMKSTPKMITTTVIALPAGVAGVMSPYPTVPSVTMTNQLASNMFANIGSGTVFST